MVCFQNSRNRSSTAREEPAAHRINDVNPRNGSATSLANSQSSPSPGPPYHPPPPETPPLSVSPFPRLLLSATLGSPPLLFGSDPDTTRRPDATRLPDLCSLLSPLRPLCRPSSSRAYDITLLPSLYVDVSVTTLFARFFLLSVHNRRLLPRCSTFGILK